MGVLVSMLLPIPHPQVVATDLVSGNSSVALVTIYLRDINDHRPTFPHSLYNLSVPEHSANGFVVTDSIHVSVEGQGQDEYMRDRVKMGWRYTEKRRPGTVALPESPYHLMPSGPRKRASCVSVYGGCVGMPMCESVSGFSLCIRKQDSFVPQSCNWQWAPSFANSMPLSMSLPHRPLTQTRARGAASPTASFQETGEVSEWVGGSERVVGLG